MKCIHVKENGARCEANALLNSSLCFWHDPDISKEERRHAQSEGGKGNKIGIREALPALTIIGSKDIISLLTDTINRVREGTLDTRTANCLGILASYLLKSFEANEIENKIEAMERIVLEKKTIYNN